MRLSGPKGPYPPEWAKGKVPDAPINVAFNMFSGLWRRNQPYRNMLVYSLSMFLERLVLIFSDKVFIMHVRKRGCYLRAWSSTCLLNFVCVSVSARVKRM